MKHVPVWSRKIVVITLSTTLAACGGSSDSTPATPVVPSTPAVLSLTLSGSASRGAVLGNKAIGITCATGKGSSTTKADGSYSYAIDGGKWPCLARVTDADGSYLHTVALGSASATTATANITPVTQLVVARLAGADPAAYYTAFDSAPAAAAVFVTATAVTAAQTSVVATLKSGGLDLTAVGDLLAATLTPAYTAALVSLDSSLASSGTTLAALTTSVVNTTPTTAAGLPVVTIGLPTLPPDQMLKPAAANCAALRSGKYRVVIPAPGAPLSNQVGSFQLDATTGGVVNSDGSSEVVVVNGACRFLGNAGKNDFVVSPAGVMVGRIADGSKFRTAIAFPEQAHVAAELVGSWNVLGTIPWDGAVGFGGMAGAATWGSDGKISSGSVCNHPATWDVVTCGSFTPGSQPLRSNATGGFDLLNEAGTAVDGRGFIYQAGSGDLIYIQVYSQGDFNIWTRQKTNSLPSMGDVKASWSLGLDEQMLSTGAVSADTHTIVSVDATAGSWVRKQKTIGGTDEHLQTWFLNNPRNGYSYRAAGSALASDGTTVNINQTTSMGLRGMGITAVLNQTKKRFQFSVEQPAP